MFLLHSPECLWDCWDIPEHQLQRPSSVQAIVPPAYAEMAYISTCPGSTDSVFLVSLLHVVCACSFWGTLPVQSGLEGGGLLQGLHASGVFPHEYPSSSEGGRYDIHGDTVWGLLVLYFNVALIAVCVGPGSKGLPSFGSSLSCVNLPCRCPTTVYSGWRSCEKILNLQISCLYNRHPSFYLYAEVWTLAHVSLKSS